MVFIRISISNKTLLLKTFCCRGPKEVSTSVSFSLPKNYVDADGGVTYSPTNAKYVYLELLNLWPGFLILGLIGLATKQLSFPPQTAVPNRSISRHKHSQCFYFPTDYVYFLKLTATVLELFTVLFSYIVGQTSGALMV